MAATAPLPSILNTPAGGFSIERQWATQLSTLHFIYDKLKSSLISACCRVLNRCLEQHVYLAGNTSGEGARGRSPFTEITENVFPSLPPSNRECESDCVCVFRCRGLAVIYGHQAKEGFLGPSHHHPPSSFRSTGRLSLEDIQSFWLYPESRRHSGNILLQVLAKKCTQCTQHQSLVWEKMSSTV